MEKYRGMDSNELTEVATEVVGELRRKAYAEGYEQGKFDAEMNAGFKTIGKAVIECGISIESDQEKRDRIVEKAKEDVDNLTDQVMGDDWFFIDGISCIGNVVPEFVVNKKKRTIVALLKYMHIDGLVPFKGIAKCAPEDCFNAHIGKAIALRRALDLEVPDEYINAPQPTEVQVGDNVRFKSFGTDGSNPRDYYVRTIKEIGKYKVRYAGGGFDFIKTINDEGVIIDDTREEASQ